MNYTLPDPPEEIIIPISKGNKMSELNKAWRDVYYMLEDNAFDYVGKPFYNDKKGTIQLWNGSSFITYAEVPF